MTYLSVGPLVRATSSSSVVIWAECVQRCRVTVKASPIEPLADTPLAIASTNTVMVGGRSYVAVCLDGLQPASWYTYQLDTDEQKDLENTNAPSMEAGEHQDTAPQYYCFRTMNAMGASAVESEQAQRLLRFAYGSCRKSEVQEIDMLSAFGSWLVDTYEQREAQWPHLLLLIGDQIYADQPPSALKDVYPQLVQGATTFEDFALLYKYAWTKDRGTRQALAAIPTYMIFDDHEVTNNWNIAPWWRAKALHRGLEQVLVDSLVAYWVYQGWGNLARETQRNHSPLLAIMYEGEQSGEDVLETLRTQVKQEIYGKADLHWHYVIPTEPPIFVANARTERTSILDTTEQNIFAPARIMSRSQMQELQNWTHTSRTSPSLLVSSVPILLPPVIGLAEYMAGRRFWQRSVAPLRWLGLRIAHFQQSFALRLSFDHWPVYALTWQELLHMLDDCEQDMIALSGDVHFSYAMEAHKVRKKRARLYQFVSTPLQNVLAPRDQQLIERQSHIARMPYGGLRTHVLPLYTADMKAHVPGNLLFQNTLALVEVETEGGNAYSVRQTYLGMVDGEVGVIGRTVVTRKPE